MAEKKTAETTAKFTKAQLAASDKYADRKDLIGALLADNEEYTITQVEDLIERYMKGEVI